MNENQTLGRVASGSRSQSFHDATTGLPENAIRPLPADVIAQLRSSTTITTLNGVVLDLLRNSLDAAATKIDISVDIRRGSCTVEDNGVGIPPSEFREDGSLGKLHCTSKYGSNAVTYGHRGTFLASLASLSLLTITSRHRAHRSHNMLVLHHSRTISRLCPAPVQHEIVSQHHGTRVTVRDLFGNMPVRVKQRTLALDAGLEYERLWDDLKKRLASIMLAWQQPITLKVVDRGSGRRLAIQGRRSLDLDNKSSYSNTGSNLGADMRCGLSLLTQLSYMTTDEGSSWVPASAKTSSVSIRGMISMDPAPSRTVQFISLGVIPLSSESGHNELFDEVNRLFHLSSFGIENDDDEVDEVEKGRGRDGLHRPDECTGKQQKGTRKRVDRWPMFCFWIALHDRPCSLESIQELPERTLKSILDVTRAMVTQWLLANHFRPRGGSQRSKGNSISVDVSSEQQALVRTPTSHASPAHTSYGNSRKIARITASRKVNRGNRVASHQDSMAFDNWSKIKSGNSTFYEHLRSSSKPSQVPNEGYSFRILDQDTINEKIPFQSESIPSGALGNSTADRQNGFSGGSTGAGTGTGDCSAQPSEDANDNMFAWTNPTDGVTYRINARTGLATKDLPWQSRPISSKNPSIRSQTNRSCLSDPTSQNNASTNWIADVLREWKNPAFAPSEECIPQAALTGSTTVESNLRDTNGKMDFASAFTNASSLLISSKISKSDLASSKVISQVDSKFILVIVASAPEKNLLVLIDQHAADERCRVEALLADICSPTPVTHDSFRSDLGHVARVKHVILSQPLDLSISTKEAELFETHAGHFAAWGILYNTEPSLAKKSNSTIMVPTSSSLKVVALPPSISERCKLDPPVLLSFLQSEVWHLRSGQQRPCPGNFTSNEMPNLPDRGADAHPWLRSLGSIPKGLLDMLNSRACRSAIMFNDCLDKGQCESLVHDLATCAFPFVCAHGRPSLVPLVELGQGTGGLDLGGRKNKVNETKQSFARAWQGWKGENDDPI